MEDTQEGKDTQKERVIKERLYPLVSIVLPNEDCGKWQVWTGWSREKARIYSFFIEKQEALDYVNVLCGDISQFGRLPVVFVSSYYPVKAAYFGNIEDMNLNNAFVSQSEVAWFTDYLEKLNNGDK